MIEDPTNLESVFSRITSSDVYARYIQNASSVVAVGPNFSVTLDASLAFACYQAKAGTVFVVEPQGDRYEEDSREHVRGVGGWKYHESELDSLRNAGVSLARPNWLGPDATIETLNDALAPESIQVVVDHGTAEFLAKNPMSDMTFDSIFERYYRVLQPGGLLLLSVHPDIDKLRSQAALARLGFTTEVFSVSDEVIIPLTMEANNALQESPLGMHLQQSTSGSPQLGFNNPHYNLRTMIVATKPLNT